MTLAVGTLTLHQFAHPASVFPSFFDSLCMVAHSQQLSSCALGIPKADSSHGELSTELDDFTLEDNRIPRSPGWAKKFG